MQMQLRAVSHKDKYSMLYVTYARLLERDRFNYPSLSEYTKRLHHLSRRFGLKDVAHNMERTFQVLFHQLLEKDRVVVRPKLVEPSDFLTQMKA
jgi:hypothetical protein